MKGWTGPPLSSGYTDIESVCRGGWLWRRPSRRSRPRSLVVVGKFDGHLGIHCCHSGGSAYLALLISYQ